jgi:hypothetical protein
MSQEYRRILLQTSIASFLSEMIYPTECNSENLIITIVNVLYKKH